MKNLSKYLLALIAIASSFAVRSQSIEAALNTLSKDFQPEKIYIHYDKDHYVAGETVWFKAYLYSNGKPSGLSNNFYLQLIDSKGSIVSNKKYPVNGATVKGNIDLPDSLPQGYYTVRALTPRMINTSPDFLYTQALYIFNPSDKTAHNGSPVKKPLSVQFFPESGYLAEGIKTTLAFKVMDSSGMPANISGILKMDDSVNLAPFKTFHDGIGRLQIKPHPGKKYTAAITYNGETHFFPLPAILASGINLRIEDEKGGKVFSLSRTQKQKEDFDKVQLVVQTGNKLVFDSEINFDDFLSVKGHLLTDSLPSGILHFTVFNKEGLPLVERIAFVDNKEYRSAAAIAVEKKGLDPKAENIVKVVFPKAIQSSCSVSVTTEDNSFGSRGNIISSLLLTEDIKGYVFDPAWYFENQNDSTAMAMDNLMLTHGWSRFSWKKILADDLPKQQLEVDKYLISLSGFLKDGKTKANVSGGSLSFFVEPEDSVNQNFVTEVDASGMFSIDSMLFRGKTKLYYGYTTSQGRERSADIYINQLPADSLVEILPATMAINYDPYIERMTGHEESINQRYLAGRSKKLEAVKELEPVLVKTQSNRRPIEEVNEKYSRGAFTSMGKMNFDNINEPENNKSLSVYDFVLRSVRHVIVEDDKFVNRKNFDMIELMSNDQLAKKQKEFDSSFKAGPYGAGGNGPGSLDWMDQPGGRNKGKHFEVAIFLNESPAYVGILKTFRMDEVALIKFYDPGFVGAGQSGPGGALAIYTKKDVVVPDNLDKLDHVEYNGYSIVREFYKPDHSIPGSANKEDKRTTLLWDPDIFTGPFSNSVELRFFNSDTGKKIKIVFEGFDTEGKLVHTEAIIEK